MDEQSRRSRFLTSPRLRGEVGLRSNPGEGDSRRTQHLQNSLMQPLTPTLSPQARGEGAQLRRSDGGL
jgi:hypothetical protein